MKRPPPQLALDYRLRIFPFFSERDQKHKTRFILETAQSFASFVYELSVKERLDGTHIHLKVVGLKPPHLSVPASGNARFERDYEALNGKYDLTIEGIDGRTNTFTLQISSANIKVLRSPRERFTELVVESPEPFTP